MNEAYDQRESTQGTETAKRHHLTPQQRRTVEDWLLGQGDEGLASLALAATGSPIDAVVTACIQETSVEVTRFNVSRLAAGLGLTIPARPPGRPRLKVDDSAATVSRGDVKHLALEVQRVLRVLEMQPLDYGKLDRMARGVS